MNVYVHVIDESHTQPLSNPALKILRLHSCAGLFSHSFMERRDDKMTRNRKKVVFFFHTHPRHNHRQRVCVLCMCDHLIIGSGSLGSQETHGRIGDLLDV